MRVARQAQKYARRAIAGCIAHNFRPSGALGRV
jgi:hypothetical protein